jgi:hypothetical protein
MIFITFLFYFSWKRDIYSVVVILGVCFCECVINRKSWGDKNYIGSVV